MTISIDQGKQGPHPNLLAALVESLNNQDFLREAWNVDEVRERDFEVLQQRTLCGISWSYLWETNQSSDDYVRSVDVSLGLAMNVREANDPRLVLYQAHRLPGREWGAARMSLPRLEHLRERPWVAPHMLSRGLGIGWGLFDRSAEIGKLRISLPNGNAAESIVEDGTALMFMPFNSAELWSSTVELGLFDPQGHELLTEEIDLGALLAST